MTQPKLKTCREKCNRSPTGAHHWINKYGTPRWVCKHCSKVRTDMPMTWYAAVVKGAKRSDPTRRYKKGQLQHPRIGVVADDTQGKE